MKKTRQKLSPSLPSKCLLRNKVWCLCMNARRVILSLSPLPSPSVPCACFVSDCHCTAAFCASSFFLPSSFSSSCSPHPSPSSFLPSLSPLIYPAHHHESREPLPREAPRAPPLHFFNLSSTHFCSRPNIYPPEHLRFCVCLHRRYDPTSITPQSRGARNDNLINPQLTENKYLQTTLGKAIYIQAGITLAGRTQQAFSIDLSKPWNVTSPLYTPMKDGIFGQAMPNALLADGETWFLVFNSTHLAIYNVRTEVVTYKASLMSFNTSPGLGAVADPANDNIIIPNGALTPALATALLKGHSDMFILTTPASEVPSSGYSIAWSTSAKTAFIVGGVTGSALSPFFGRWVNTGSYAWERIASLIGTSGEPSGREMACMVPAYNGTQLVLYGGRTSTGTLNDIYIYNVLKSTWKQGSPGGPRNSRSSHTCAVSGDFFIAWGGLRMSIDTPSEYTSVYNLKTNTWVDRYEAPAPKTTTTTTTKAFAPTSDSTSSPTVPSSTPEPTSQPSGSSFERIGIPVIAVVVVVILAALLFILYRRKKAKKNTDHPSGPIPLGHMDDKSARSPPPVPHRPDDASHHFQKTALYNDIKRQPQQHQQYPIPYTAAHLNEHSPGSTHRQPQGNEVQAQELLLQEYESRRQRQLEEQRELEQRIEQQRADLQMMKGGGGQREWDQSTAEYTPQTERRGPQYWSMGSSGDRELPGQGWTQPQQPRGVQAYYPSKQT